MSDWDSIYLEKLHSFFILCENYFFIKQIRENIKKHSLIRFEEGHLENNYRNRSLKALIFIHTYQNIE